jgi:DNA-binding CsgD family transcriptional regulator
MQMAEGPGEAPASIPSPLDRCHVAVDDHPGSYNEDLAWIIRQFKERVGAGGVAVIIHYAAGRAAEIEIADSEEGPSRSELQRLAGAKEKAAGRAPAWREPDKDFPWHALTMDLASNGCSRAVIHALYPQDGAIERSAVEFVASRFQPVLAGYFKLWLLHRSTSRRMQTIIAALAPVDFGVIVLDSNAKVTFENPAATAILDDGSAFRRCRGSVSASDTAASARLRVAIDEALSAGEKNAGGGASSLVLVKPPRRAAPFVAAVAAVEEQGPGENDPAAVIHIFEPSAAVDQMIAPVCQFYGLSSMETRLVMMLLAGRAVPDIAAAENIKQDTVRTYLKNVFRKTNTKSQADLVRAMLTSSVRLRTPVKTRGMKNLNYFKKAAI